MHNDGETSLAALANIMCFKYKKQVHKAKDCPDIQKIKVLAAPHNSLEIAMDAGKMTTERLIAGKNARRTNVLHSTSSQNKKQ